MKTKYIWSLFVVLGLVACETDDNTTTDDMTVELTAGSADFSNYIAVGASFTAGFSDGALFIASQENSFPNILSQQFVALGGSETFTQPLMSDNNGGLLLGGNQIANPRLFFDGAGPAVLPAAPTTEVSAVIPGPYNNMGVPGAKSFHLLANGYGNVAGVPVGLANPYFARMASNPNASMLEDTAAQGPSFFTLSEIGGNDVLGFATSGGAGVDQTGNPDPTTYGPNDITDPTAFQTVFGALVATLTAGGAGGAVTNVPYVTSLPYFTTVPYNPVPLDGATANAVNQGYAAYNGGLLQAEALNLITTDERVARTIAFAEGTNNAVVIEDEDLTDLSGLGLPSLRQTTAEDLVVLPAASFIGTLVGGNPLQVNGVSVPLADNWVLTATETQAVINATDAYNTSIAQIASGAGLAVVDLNSILEEASTIGIAFDDFVMDTSLVFGGLVSLDGIHLTARGYALMANKFLEAIDATYGSNFIEAGQRARANDYVVAYPPTL